MRDKSTRPTYNSGTDWKKLWQEDDSDINYDDSPPTDTAFWATAKVIMPVKKVPISVRLDQDIIEYFKQQGTGYQSRINAVLRAYVTAHQS